MNADADNARPVSEPSNTETGRFSRPAVYFFIQIVLLLTLVLMLLGQTVAVFNYDLAGRIGLQEPREQVTEFGVRVNRSFAVSDTILYVPLIALSIIGLHYRRRWAIIVLSASMGISAYWSATSAVMLFILHGAPGYKFAPSLLYYVPLCAYTVFGVWGLCYLVARGRRLLD